MDDLIKRQDAINALHQMEYKVDSDGYAWVIWIDVCKTLDELPSAEPERTAKIKNQTDRRVLYKASDFGVIGECECGYQVIADYDYCPKCGARLEWG